MGRQHRQYEEHIRNLNHEHLCTRLDSLRKLSVGIKKGDIPPPEKGEDVNNHIHTTYSFSPYSPTKAVWKAYMSGLATAGIMDHDTIRGAEEFREAGRIIGLPVTSGVECRVDFSDTPLNGKKINNPDQHSIAYMAIHAIPETMTQKVDDFFKPFIKARDRRNRKMIGKLNELFLTFDIQLDYDMDILPLSNFKDGGTVTERHILFGLTKKLISKYGRGNVLVGFLEDSLDIVISDKIKTYLLDITNQYYEYDLMGVLKSDLVQKFYINADDECPNVRDVIKLTQDIGAISAYAYLGDVVSSVTGDKRPQKFEDEYLDELFKVLIEVGFNAVTYMPSRNTLEQLRRVKKLCRQHGLMDISGEDINQPRQKFICQVMKNDEFTNLKDTAWSLIGNEKAASRDLTKAMFSKETRKRYHDLEERIQIYKNIGKQC
jgi:hypothetical protein